MNTILPHPSSGFYDHARNYGKAAMEIGINVFLYCPIATESPMTNLAIGVTGVALARLGHGFYKIADNLEKTYESSSRFYTFEVDPKEVYKAAFQETVLQKNHPQYTPFFPTLRIFLEADPTKRTYESEIEYYGKYGTDMALFYVRDGIPLDGLDSKSYKDYLKAQKTLREKAYE